MENKVIHFSLPGGLRRREEEGEQGEEEGDVGEGQDGAHPQGYHGPGPRETADNHGGDSNSIRLSLHHLWSLL